MSDHVDRAAKAIADFNACGHCEGTCGTCRGEAEALADADLLATPEHDAAVAAKALEVAASVMEGDTDIPDHRAGRSAIRFLRDRADSLKVSHE